MNISLSLNEKSIDEAIKKLDDYAKRVDELPSKVVKRLSEDGAKQAQEIAMYMNAYDSGELVNGIISEASGNKGKIISTAPHSAFVEMGTGIVGKEKPNQNGSIPGWVYDVNEHGESGWTYFNEKDGKYHWTKGMPSRPFMYDTAQILKEAVPDIVKDEFGSG